MVRVLREKYRRVRGSHGVMIVSSRMKGGGQGKEKACAKKEVV